MIEHENASVQSWTIQSLARGLKLLERIAEQSGGCNAKWLSRVSGINLSTCYHLLNTLDQTGYIQKDKLTQNYTLTYRVSYLSNLVQSQRVLPEKIRLLANTLAQKTRETAYVATWENGEVVISHIVESNQAVKVRSLFVGYHDHPFVRALGKAVLAYVSDGELMKCRERHRLERRTPHSKVDWEQTLDALRTTRDQGYSRDEQEYELGICCIGVPIFKYDGGIWGAMSISMPSTRYDPSDMTIIAYLKGEALAASLSLGYDPQVSGRNDNGRYRDVASVVSSDGADSIV